MPLVQLEPGLGRPRWAEPNTRRRSGRWAEPNEGDTPPLVGGAWRTQRNRCSPSSQASSAVPVRRRLRTPREPRRQGAEAWRPPSAPGRLQKLLPSFSNAPLHVSAAPCSLRPALHCGRRPCRRKCSSCLNSARLFRPLPAARPKGSESRDAAGHPRCERGLAQRAGMRGG